MKPLAIILTVCGLALTVCGCAIDRRPPWQRIVPTHVPLMLGSPEIVVASDTEPSTSNPNWP